MSDMDKEIYEWQRNIDWETPPCNYCGCDAPDFYLETPDKRFHGKPLRLVKCPECGLIYASPRPTTESYIKVYRTLWAEETRRFKYLRPGVEGWHRDVILRAKKYKPDARTLFDVGTGAGTVLIAGRRLGLRVAGNDLNKPAVDWLRERGYNVYNEPTKDIVVNEQYDLVTCLDYIEHTNTPLEDLKWIRAHLKGGGVMYLKTMYLDSEVYRREGAAWSLLSGFHTHYFYKDVLLSMVRDAGLVTVWTQLDPEIIHLIARKP